MNLNSPRFYVSPPPSPSFLAKLLSGVMRRHVEAILAKDMLHNKGYVSACFEQDNLSEFDAETQQRHDAPGLSWHYPLFWLFNRVRPFREVLEIGTFDGKFAAFMHDCSCSNVVTIDLPSDDYRFINSYDRREREKRTSFINARDSLLARRKDRLKFIEMDSADLAATFGTSPKYDFVWVDGDHTSPRVEGDIAQCLDLLKEDGIMLCDDVLPFAECSGSSTSASFLYLEALYSDGRIDVEYVLKRIRPSNSRLMRRKYIAIIKKVKS